MGWVQRGGGEGVGGGGGVSWVHRRYMLPLLDEILAADGVDGWTVETCDYQLMQTLLRQSEGATAAAALPKIVPVLAKLLDPR